MGYFKNAIDSANLGDIESAEDVERAFKSECVFCSFVCTTYEKEYQPKLEIEEKVVEVVDVTAPIDVLFGGDDSDYDSETDPVWSVNAQVVNAMFASVDSDAESEEESEDEEEDSLSDIEE